MGAQISNQNTICYKCQKFENSVISEDNCNKIEQCNSEQNQSVITDVSRKITRDQISLSKDYLKQSELQFNSQKKKNLTSQLILQDFQDLQSKIQSDTKNKYVYHFNISMALAKFANDNHPNSTVSSPNDENNSKQCFTNEYIKFSTDIIEEKCICTEVLDFMKDRQHKKTLQSKMISKGKQLQKEFDV